MSNNVRNSWGFSLFCDDIRAEVGGKLTVVGIYQQDMIFQPPATFPITLPKFCILIKYYELQGVLTEDMTLNVFLPGDPRNEPTIKIPIPRAGFADIVLPYALDEDQERVFNVNYPLVISPFQIKQEGFLKVRAICGAVTTNLGSMMVRMVRPNELIQTIVMAPAPSDQPPPLDPGVP